MKKRFARLLFAIVTIGASILIGKALIRRFRGYRESILIAGGGVSAQVDFYTSLTGFTSGSNQMMQTRRFHTETRLFEVGRILFTGGMEAGVVLNSAELYNPYLNTFNATAASMKQGRVFHTATLLPGGWVLIAGGESGSHPPIIHNTAEFYDPYSDSFSGLISMPHALRYHTATLIANFDVGAKVLLVGSGFAFFYDPFLRSFIPINSQPSARSLHTATSMGTLGPVLIAGGFDNNNIALNTAELFQPNQFFNVGNMIDSRREHTATLLKTGKILIAGGMNNEGMILDRAELFDADNEIFIPVSGRMTSARYRHSAIQLSNGEVLITGGQDANDSIGSSEIYSPVTDSFRSVGTMSMPRFGHTATELTADI